MNYGIYGSSEDNFSSILVAKEEAKEETNEDTTGECPEASSLNTNAARISHALPLKSTGKRSRTEEDDSSGSEFDEVEGTANDNEDESEEALPAWMRYLPRTNFAPSSSSTTAATTTEDAYKEPDIHVPISKQPPSSNRFGPTSLTAKSQKRPRFSSSKSQIKPTSHQRIPDKLKRSNVSEAAMLFSLSSGLGANK